MEQQGHLTALQTWNNLELDLAGVLHRAWHHMHPAGRNLTRTNGLYVWPGRGAVSPDGFEPDKSVSKIMLYAGYYVVRTSGKVVIDEIPIEVGNFDGSVAWPLESPTVPDGQAFTIDDAGLVESMVQGLELQRDMGVLPGLRPSCTGIVGAADVLPKGILPPEMFNH